MPVMTSQILKSVAKTQKSRYHENKTLLFSNKKCTNYHIVQLTLRPHIVNKLYLSRKNEKAIKSMIKT